MAYELLDLAVEHPVGLVEIRNQWPRELVLPVLVDLISNGLLVIGAERDITANTEPPPDASTLQAMLEEPRTWEPTVEDWRTNTYMALVATAAGELEYERPAEIRSS